MNYQIFPPEEIKAEIQLPLSKSISNRVLIINALTGNKGTVKGVAKCDDSDVMCAALTTAFNSENDFGTINIGAAGTAMRFLTAYFAVAKPGSTVILDGSDKAKLGLEGRPAFSRNGHKLPASLVSLYPV